MGERDRAPDDPALVAFWTERHLCTLTTLRSDGSPHVVPVGATLDPEAGLVRVITAGTSAKARHVAEAPAGTARVAICQVDGGNWSTIEGIARVTDHPDEVAEAVRRYALRYRQPRENPERVAIVVEIRRILGPLPR